jgi:hypothetical protein
MSITVKREEGDEERRGEETRRRKGGEREMGDGSW